MLRLNLVSQELKRDIKLRRVYDLLKRANYILIIITVFVAVIILVAKIILQNNFNKIVEQTTLITKNNQGYNYKAKEINSYIDYVYGIQDNFIPWSYLLLELSNSANNNIKFNFIKIDKARTELSMNGVARTRSDLLKFKDGIEQSAMFNIIDFPVRNILEKENINFTIKAGINLEEIL